MSNNLLEEKLILKEEELQNQPATTSSSSNSRLLMMEPNAQYQPDQRFVRMPSTSSSHASSSQQPPPVVNVAQFAKNYPQEKFSRTSVSYLMLQDLLLSVPRVALYMCIVGGILVLIGYTADKYYPNKHVGGLSFSSWALLLGIIIGAQFVCKLLYWLLVIVFHWVYYLPSDLIRSYARVLYFGGWYFLWSIAVLIIWQVVINNNPFPAHKDGEDVQVFRMWWITRLLGVHLIFGMLLFGKYFLLTSVRHQRKVEGYGQKVYNNLLDGQIIAQLSSSLSLSEFQRIRAQSQVAKPSLSAQLVKKVKSLKKMSIETVDVNDVLEFQPSGSRNVTHQGSRPDDASLEFKIEHFELMCMALKNEILVCTDSHPLQTSSESEAVGIGVVRLFASEHREGSPSASPIASLRDSIEQREALLARFDEIFPQTAVSVDPSERLYGNGKESSSSDSMPAVNTVSEDKMSKFCSAVFNRRLQLQQTMDDLESIFGALSSFLTGIITLCVFIALMIAFGEGEYGSVTLSLSSTLLAFSFVFGEACKNAFNSFLFLFARHPFDVGDRISLESDPNFFFVTRMELMTTYFRQWDGKVVSMPNYTLHAMKIFNVRRSGPLTDVIEISIPASTPLEVVQKLEENYLAILRAAPEDFNAFESYVRVVGVDSQSSITLQFAAAHASNWQNGELSVRRHTLLICIQKLCADLKLDYKLLESIHVSLVGQATTVSSLL